MNSFKSENSSWFSFPWFFLKKEQFGLEIETFEISRNSAVLLFKKTSSQFEKSMKLFNPVHFTLDYGFQNKFK